MDRKIIKEYTGHTSDAVDQYQITSDDQRKELSKIIGGGSKDKVAEKCTQNWLEMTVKECSQGREMECNCKKQQFNFAESDKLGSLITQLVQNRKSGKATVRIEVEFSD